LYLKIEFFFMAIVAGPRGPESYLDGRSSSRVEKPRDHDMKGEARGGERERDL
jgi:hypothetical protein